MVFGVTMLEAVIFDLGGVLVDWDPRHLYRDLIADEAALERFVTEVCPMSWHRRLDAGESFAAAIAERITQFPREAALIRAYDTGWPRMFKGQIAGTVDLLSALDAAGMPLYAITNFPTEKWSEFLASYPFSQRFRDVIVSGREGIIKPDRRIYDLAMRRFQVRPEHTLFIDDRADNAAAAAAVGFRTHHFSDPARLEAALREAGLI